MAAYLKPTAEHLRRAMAEQAEVDREIDSGTGRTQSDYVATECESCAEGGEHGVPAIGHSKNPDWSGYDLCQDCIDEYDARTPIEEA